MDKLAYSINETAKALSLGRTSIYALIAEGRLVCTAVTNQATGSSAMCR